VSRPGRGAIFQIDLPLVAPEQGTEEPIGKGSRT
jgi:hypothetical protein